MTWWLWVIVILVVWFLLSIPIAIALGRMIRGR